MISTGSRAAPRSPRRRSRSSRPPSMPLLPTGPARRSRDVGPVASRARNASMTRSCQRACTRDRNSSVFVINGTSLQLMDGTVVSSVRARVPLHRTLNKGVPYSRLCDNPEYGWAASLLRSNWGPAWPRPVARSGTSWQRSTRCGRQHDGRVSSFGCGRRAMKRRRSWRRAERASRPSVVGSIATGSRRSTPPGCRASQQADTARPVRDHGPLDVGRGRMDDRARRRPTLRSSASSASA